MDCRRDSDGYESPGLSTGGPRPVREIAFTDYSSRASLFIDPRFIDPRLGLALGRVRKRKLQVHA